MLTAQAVKSESQQEVVIEIDFANSMDVFPCIETKLQPMRRQKN
jgi:hypothetical protein